MTNLFTTMYKRAEGPVTYQPMATPWAVERRSKERAVGPMHWACRREQRDRPFVYISWNKKEQEGAGPSALNARTRELDPWRCHGLVCLGPLALVKKFVYGSCHGQPCKLVSD